MNKLADIRIGKKLAILVGINLFLLACGIGVGWWGQNTLDKMMDVAVLESHKVSAADKIAADVSQIGLRVSTLLIAKQFNPETESGILALRKEYLATFEEIYSQSKAPEGIRLLKITEQATTKWRDTNKEMMDLAKAGRRAEAQAIYMQRSLRITNEMNESIQNYLSYRKSELAKVEDDQNAVVSQVKLLLVACGLISLIVASVLGLLFTRSITTPLSATIVQLEIVAKGDVSSTMDAKYLQRGDEIGLLSKAVQAMSESLRSVIGDINQRNWGPLCVLGGVVRQFDSNVRRLAPGVR